MENKENMTEFKSNQYKEALNQSKRLKEAETQLRQLDKEIQDFMIDEISLRFKEKQALGLKLDVFQCEYDKFKNDSLYSEFTLKFSLKPEIDILECLKEFGFKWNNVVSTWNIGLDKIVSSKKGLQYIKALQNGIKNNALNTIPTFEELFPNISRVKKANQKIESKPKAKEETKITLDFDPKLCRKCQDKPFNTSRNVKTSDGSVKEIKLCLTCDIITPDNYILEI